MRHSFRHNIDVVIDPAQIEKQKAGALYDNDKNTFYFKSYDFGMKWTHEKAGIIHECVHAMQDIRKAKHTYFEEEAAAYITQYLYLRYATGGMSVSKYFVSTTPIMDAADAIAEKMVGKMDVLVDLPDLVNLMHIIQRSPTYADIDGDPPAHNDGVWGAAYRRG